MANDFKQLNEAYKTRTVKVTGKDADKLLPLLNYQDQERNNRKKTFVVPFTGEFSVFCETPEEAWQLAKQAVKDTYVHSDAAGILKLQLSGKPYSGRGKW